MSGIVGIWHMDGRPVERALLADMSAMQAHRGPDGEGVWIQGPVGFACQLLRITPEASTETQPLVHASGAALVFDGRLDNREEVLAALPASAGVTAGSPDPALVLAVYETLGHGFAERLAGDFALALFDPARRHLLLARDAIGIRPLYYYRTRDLFLFASEIKALLAHPQVPARPNDDIIADLLLNRARNTEGMTCFDGVSSLPPAHLAILTPGGFITRRYWDFDPARRTRLRSFPEYAEAFRHHFKLAVGRRLRSAYPVAISVSGGVDSSSIFCLAETLRRSAPGHHPPILGISYISPEGSPSDEAGFLLDIERAYGVAIERIPMRPPGLPDRSREALWHVESPFLDELWNTTRAFHRAAHHSGARVLLTGHWGDQVLFGQAYLIDMLYRLAWGQVRAHLKEFGRWFTDADPRYWRRQLWLDLIRHHVPDPLLAVLRRIRRNRVPPWFTARLRERARRVPRTPNGVRGPFATAHARSLYREVRSRYYVQCMEWENKVGGMHGLEMAFPFLDRDLVAFLMGIPGEMRTWKGVPKALLREAMRGMLPSPIVERRSKADFTDLVNEGVERGYPLLVDCLPSDGMAVRRDYLRGDVLTAELVRLKEEIGRDPGCETAWDLTEILGLELWLQVFFGKNGRRREDSRSPAGGPAATPAGGTR